MDSKKLNKNIFKNLIVITHCDHTISSSNKIQAYTPYVREINMWCELFENVIIYGPTSKRTLNTSIEEFKYDNIKLKTIFFSNSSNKTDLLNILFNYFLKFFRFIQLPIIFLQLLPIISSTNVIHLRSPSYPAFVSSILIKIFNKKSIIKYAGGFHSFPKENFISKIQRLLLLDYMKKSKVLVYDKVNRSNFITFFPALYSKYEVEKFRDLKIANNSVKQFLCVGRLNIDKGFDLVIEAFGLIKKNNPKLNWNLTFVGDGEYKNTLKRFVKQNNIEDNVFFKGTLSFTKTLEKYSNSDALIMPGVKEGWPKTIAEAWVTKTFVISANRGNCERIIGDNSGVLFEPNKLSLYNVILNFLNKVYDTDSYILNGLEKSKNLTLESYKLNLKKNIIELYG